MKISGFHGKKMHKLYYRLKKRFYDPTICDEFIIAVGKGDEDDNTVRNRKYQ